MDHHDTNQDFVKLMIPHHQSAVDMANAYLKEGTDPQLVEMAQKIIQLAQGVMIRKQAAAKSIASLHSVPDFQEARGVSALHDNSAEFSSDGVYQCLESIGGEE